MRNERRYHRVPVKLLPCTMMKFKTADLCDDYSDMIQIVEPGMLDFGGHRSFNGPISTVRCFEDNSKVREQLSTDGEGRVLVVDAGGSRRCAMLGDILAEKAVSNGWAGVVMFGLIRDSDEIGQMALGVKALGTHPKKSEKRDIGDIDVAVNFMGVNFNPDAWLYADADGIIVSDCELTASE
jgi:regulator of ribonuclease activity A